MQTIDQLQWEAIVKLQGIKGAAFETREHGYTYKGPIDMARLTGDGRVLIHQSSLVRVNPIGEEVECDRISYWYQLRAADSPPRLDDGRILFDLPGGGLGIIIPA